MDRGLDKVGERRLVTFDRDFTRLLDRASSSLLSGTDIEKRLSPGTRAPQESCLAYDRAELADQVAQGRTRPVNIAESTMPYLSDQAT